MTTRPTHMVAVLAQEQGQAPDRMTVGERALAIFVYAVAADPPAQTSKAAARDPVPARTAVQAKAGSKSDCLTIHQFALLSKKIRGYEIFLRERNDQQRRPVQGLFQNRSSISFGYGFDCNVVNQTHSGQMLYNSGWTFRP